MALHWINHGLPFRPADIYGLFSKAAGEIPPIEDREIERYSQFASALDLADAQQKDELPALGPNPVAMEWVEDIAHNMLPEGPTSFLHDWAYDITWYEEGGKVYCSGMLVANSLPEFLARLRVESDIWYRLLDVDRTIFCQVLSRNPRSIQRMWQDLPETMPPRLMAYLQHLREKRLPASAEPAPAETLS